MLSSVVPSSPRLSGLARLCALVARELTKIGQKVTSGAVADWRVELKSLPPDDRRAKDCQSILNMEVELTGRSPGRHPIQDGSARAKVGLQILEVLTKFITLSHLTDHANLLELCAKIRHADLPNLDRHGFADSGKSCFSSESSFYSLSPPITNVEGRR
jgi:hypothetical protein